MHVKFTDKDVYLDSDVCGDEPLVVTVVRLDDSNSYEVTKEEFARLVALLEGRP